MNYNYISTNRIKLINADNRVENFFLQYLEACLLPNFIIFFTTIDDLFNNFKDIFSNSHEKKHVIDKFQELKIGTNSFIDFYSKFICVASDLKYTSEIVI